MFLENLGEFLNFVDANQKINYLISHVFLWNFNFNSNENVLNVIRNSPQNNKHSFCNIKVCKEFVFSFAVSFIINFLYEKKAFFTLFCFLFGVVLQMV